MGRVRLMTVASVLFLNVMGCLLFLRSADQLPSSFDTAGIPVIVIPANHHPDTSSNHKHATNHRLPKRSATTDQNPITENVFNTTSAIFILPDENVTESPNAPATTTASTPSKIIRDDITTRTSTSLSDDVTSTHFRFDQKTEVITATNNNDSSTVVEPTTTAKPHPSSATSLPANNPTSLPVNGSIATKFISTIHFRYVINQEHVCNNDSFELLVMVCSSVRNFRQRMAIRKTWGSVAGETGNTSLHDDIRILFLLGLPKDPTTQQKVLLESSKHGDIIQENFLDSYRNLTLKSVMLLRWVTEYCPGVKFVLKVDDDMFLHLPNLLRLLHTRLGKSSSGLLAGALNQGAKPIRTESHKWFVPHSQYPGKVYPDYLSGTAYLMSRDVAPKLYAAAHVTPFLAMEDIFITGVCASKAGVKRKMLPGFVYWKRAPTGCAFKNAISGHYVSMTDMFTIWRDLGKTDLRCVKATLKTNRIRRGAASSGSSRSKVGPGRRKKFRKFRQQH